MAIALDTATTKTGAAASYTWAHTCTGADLILVVEIAWVASDAGRWINTVTYDGIALTKVAGLVSDRDRCELWYLIGPPTGSNNVVVTNAGAGGKTAEIAAGAVSYTGVHQIDPISGFVTQTGSGASITKDISSGADNLVVDIVAAHTNGVGVSFAPGGGQSEEWNVEFGTIIEGAGSREAGASTVTMSWTCTAATLLQQIIMSLQPSSTFTVRPISYTLDVWDPEQRILDSAGHVVPRYKVKPNRWAKIVGLGRVDAEVYENNYDDPNLVYFESVKYDGETDQVEIITNRGNLPEIILARLMSGGTG